MNRLADSTSPYLLLHADNPVDWYPWGPEALEAAERDDKPIFLSVGYSTCYWCHVMERESFADQETAALMNQHFVNIKLDREERPDLDEIYMSATQVLTQHGGWPNSLFLTPQLEPFFAGTYFPPVDRPGLPSFRTVLNSMAEAWRTRRSDVEQQAESIGAAIRHHLEDRPDPADELPDPALAERSYVGLERSFDPTWGGFGSAPKFPTPSNLFLLLELAEEKPHADEMLAKTLDHMARGGIYDQLGGGFHRYATDREWNVPHFEKMLYDNGFLLEAYGRQYRRTSDRQSERIIRGVAEFLARELTSPEGAFWSALDAETDGKEGAFHVWTREELADVLGDEDFGFLAPIYGFDRDPFFEGSHYVLHLPERLAAQAERRQLALDQLMDEIEPLRQKLFEARSVRKHPLTDDKILTDWNGAAIGGLAIAGSAIGEPVLVDQAATAARFILAEMTTPDGILLHSWRSGAGKIPAFLSDYAFLVHALIALARAPGQPADVWLDAATLMTEEQIARLGDRNGGYFAAAEAPDVLVRSKDIFDGATPSANSMAILNLIELYELTGEAKWLAEAERSLRAFAPTLERLAEPARMMTVAVRRAAELIAPSPTTGLEQEALEQVRVRVSWGETDGGGVRDFAARVEIASGWHVYASYPAGEAPEWIVPFELSVEGGELVDVVFPEASELPPILGRERVLIYEGDCEIKGRLRVDPTGPEPTLRLTWQACDATRCLPKTTVRSSFASDGALSEG